MYDRIVKEALEKAGWYEGRKLDISDKVKTLEKYGCEVFDKAKEFLQEFEELKIPNMEHIADSTRCNIIDVGNTFNFLMSYPESERERLYNIRCRNTRCKEKVVKIGIVAGGEAELFITETGRIVTDIFVIGNTIEEGIENLVKNTSSSFLKEWFVKDNFKQISVNDFRIEDDTLIEYIVKALSELKFPIVYKL